MITQLPEGGIRFSIELDEFLVQSMPSSVLEVASAQLAAELVALVGEKMLSEMDVEDIRTRVSERAVEKLSSMFGIVVSNPPESAVKRSVTTEQAKSMEADTKAFKMARGAKV